jgi:membrane protease YdiL (CAAX protease family)
MDDLEPVSPASRSFVPLALATYGVMAGLSALAIWWWRLPVGAVADLGGAIGWGLAAALPLMALLLVFDRWPPRLLAPLKHSVDRQVVPLLARLSIFEFLVISLAAGCGEELLFRGVLQQGLAHALAYFEVRYAVAASVLLAGAIFGVCHWLNWQYALVAGVVGAYLGWVYVATGSLAAPVTAHAAYDFFALCYLVKWPRRPSPPAPPLPPND